MNDTIDIHIFFGSFSDLTNIDMSFINIEIVVYKSLKFKKKIELLGLVKEIHIGYDYIINDNKNLQVFEEEKIRRYALMPIDVSKEFTNFNCNHFRNLMLSIYPSDFALVEIIHLSKQKEGYAYTAKSTYPFKSSESYYKNFMYIDRSEYNFVKLFIKSFFRSSQNLQYVRYILNQYANSYEEPNPLFQYINLIICLEVVVEGNEQLSYKLRRNIALICGNDTRTCDIIYDNVKHLYGLRSAIVHGNINPSYTNFKEYLHYLKNLVSKLIRELIVHNISNVADLNEKINKLGYGQNSKISDSYRKYRYPLISNSTLNFEKLTKYK